MHTNEQYEGRRLGTLVEIETHHIQVHANESGAHRRTVSPAETILSDAHHLGVHTA